MVVWRLCWGRSIENCDGHSSAHLSGDKTRNGSGQEEEEEEEIKDPRKQMKRSIVAEFVF
jgi:hypothetical protein